MDGSRERDKLVFTPAAENLLRSKYRIKRKKEDETFFSLSGNKLFDGGPGGQSPASGRVALTGHENGGKIPVGAN